MVSLCEIPHSMTLVSAKGECPDLDDRLKQSLKETLTIYDVAAGLSKMTEGVPTVLKQEKSPKYGEQSVIYFCTPKFVVRCIVTQDRLFPK
jgi:hypothetical protein